MEENLDFSKAFEQLQEMLSNDDGKAQIQNILGMFSANDSQESQTTSSPSAPNPPGIDGLDLGTIAKISEIMQALSAPDNNAGAAFLNSLKPFLKESRQKRLDQATGIIKLLSVFKAFKKTEEGGV